MPQLLTLANLPNQIVRVNSLDNRWELTFKSTTNLLTVTLGLNNVTLLSGYRVVPGIPLIPYRYLETGNFIFLTENNDYPFYTAFNQTQQLFYFTQAELNSI